MLINLVVLCLMIGASLALGSVAHADQPADAPELPPRVIATAQDHPAPAQSVQTQSVQVPGHMRGGIWIPAHTE